VFQYNDSGYKFTSATLYVPKGTKEKYEATTAWNLFKTIIEMDGGPQGDLTGDSEVNGTDLVALVNVIMKGGSNPAADVNNDGEVNGTDLVALVNIIMRPGSSRELMAARGADASSGNANDGVTIGAELLNTNSDGSSELAITLSNPQMDVTMVQMDMTLPEGLTLVDDDNTDMMAGRTTWRTHQLYTANSNDGRNARLMLASGRNTPIEGTEGGIMQLKLRADESFRGGDIILHDILCTSPSLEEARPADVLIHVGEATGVCDALLQDDLGEKAVYNLSGQRMNTLRKGVNIVNGKKLIK